MPFFSNLADRISGYTLQLTITKDGDKLTVMVYPKVSEKDEIQKQITPLLMTGTPTELDQEFFTALGTRLDSAKDAANQIKNYEKGLTKAVEIAEKSNKTSASDAGKKDEPKTIQTNLELDQTDKDKKEPQQDVPDNAPDKVDKETGEIGNESEKAGTDEPVAAAAADDEVTADSPESESEETTPGSQGNESGSDQASEDQRASTDGDDEDW